MKGEQNRLGRLFYSTVLVLGLLWASSLVFRGAPKVQALAADRLSFQARVLSKDRNSAPTGNYSFRFAIYNSSGGGSEIWSETYTGGGKVSVRHGLFTVELGSQNSLSSIDWQQSDLYLQVQFDSDDNGTFDQTFGSRIPLTAVPFAVTANKLGGKAESTFGNLGENETVSGSWEFGGDLTTNKTTVNGVLTANALSTFKKAVTFEQGISVSGTTTLASALNGILKTANGVVSGSATLDDLGGTTLSSATTNDVLQFNGTDWVNKSLATAGIQPTLTTGNLTTTTSGVTVGGGTGAVVGTGATVDIATASGSATGLLSSGDWTTFNAKQSTVTTGNLTGTTNQVSLSGSGTGVLLSSNIQLSLPQDIHTGASPTFSTLNLSATSNQIVLQSTGVTGTLTWTPTSSNKTIILPDASGTVAVSATTPLSLSAAGDISIQDAVADGSTKGAATFVASDFNDFVGAISIDYTNGQEASALNKGFLTAADWSTFNAKMGTLSSYNLTGTANQVSLSDSGAGVLLGRSIQLTLPQNIHTGASPTFAALNLSGTSNQLVMQSAGVTGTLTWTPTSGDKSIILPDASGTVAVSVSALPLSLSAAGALSIADAVADGATKGAAAFTAADFDASSGVISIDYTNGQAASGAAKGFLTSADWTTFDSKISANQTITLSGDVSGTGTTAITTAIGSDRVTEAMLKAVNSPTDEYVLTYESTTGDFEWTDYTLAQVTGRGATTTTLVNLDGGIAVDTSNFTVDGTTGATVVGAVNAAGESANALTLSGTLGIMNGSDTFRGLYINYTNVDHTVGSNVFNGIDLANSAVDAETTETAINVGINWDYGITLAVGGTAALNLSSTAGTAAGGIILGADTNLYRSGAHTLKTDDSLTVGVDVTTLAQGDLRLSDSDSDRYVGFQSPATVVDNQVWTLPADDGSTGQVLKTDGSGILDWVSIGAATTLDAAYNEGKTITVDAGPIVLNDSGAATSLFVINQSGTINGVASLFDIDYSGSISNGSDYVSFDSTGVTNGGAGNSVGALFTGWDIGLKIADGAVYSLQLASTDGDAASGITFGTDTNLYRSAANTLKTDDSLAIAGTSVNLLNQSDLRLYEADPGTNYVGFQAPSTVGSDVLWTLPNADGGTGNVLKSDGAGTLYWDTDNTGGVGGDTLDSSYNNGRTITVDAGPIILNDSGATTSLLDINQSGTILGTAPLFDIDYTGTISNAADYVAISLTGKPNGGGGQSVAIGLNGFDVDFKSYRADTGGTNAFLFNTSNTLSSATLFVVQNNGTSKLVLDAAGQLILPTTGTTGGLLIGGDTNLYRSDTNTLKTDDSLIVGGNITDTGLTSGRVTYAGALGILQDSANMTFAGTYGLTLAAGSTSGLQLSSTAGTAAGGILFGTDTTLYRSTTDTLKTDDSLIVGGNITDTGLTSGRVTYAGALGILQDSANMTFAGTYGLTLAAGSTSGLQLSSTAGTAAGGILFGTDTTLYRSAADTLTTTDNFNVGSELVVNANSTDTSGIGIYIAGTITSTGNAQALYSFANLTPANTYNAYFLNVGGLVSTGGSNTIAKAIGIYASSMSNFGSGTVTDAYAGYFTASSLASNNYGVAIEATGSATLWVSSNADSTTAAGGITFGSSKDTNIYRSAANTLKTDDSLAIAGTSTNLLNQADLRLYEADPGTNYVGLQAPSSITSDLIWTLPSADGTGGYVLSTDGSGNLSWVSVTSGSLPAAGTLGRTLYDNGVSWVASNSALYNNGTSVGIGLAGVAPNNTIQVANLINFDGTNTALGSSALAANVSGVNNTAVGYSTLQTSTTASYNTAVGSRSLKNNTGSNNTALGYNSLTANTSGGGNSAVGAYTLQANTLGEYNTGIGSYSLSSNNTGGWNSALGYGSLASNTSGTQNTAIGYYALFSNSTTGANIAVGFQALYTNTGSSNVAIGNSALFANTIGQYNTALGHSAGDSITSGSSNILIGYNVDVPTATTSNFLNIGDTVYANLANDFVGIGTGTTVPTFPLEIASSSGISIGGSSTGRKTFVASTSSPYDMLTISSLALAGLKGQTNINLSYNGGSAYTAMVIQDQGGSGTQRVGIGTTTPETTLEVRKDAAGLMGADLVLSNKATNTTNSSVAIDFGVDSSNASGTVPPYYGANWQIKVINTDSTALNPSDMLFTSWSGANFGERMRLKADGKVGIGTASPGTSLDILGGLRVRGGAPGALGVNNNGYCFGGGGSTGDNDSCLTSNADGQLNFYNNSVEVARIMSGNVGIGTTSPGSSLDVAGTITVSNTVADLSFRENDSTYRKHSVWLTNTGANGGKVGGITNYPGAGTSVSSNSIYFVGPGDSNWSNWVPTMTILGASGTGVGNVGIGTTNPAQGKLEVAQDISVSNSLELGQIMAVGSTNRLKRTIVGYDTTNNVGYISAGISGTAWGSLILQSGGGRVGIGTTSPGYALNVISTENNWTGRFENTYAAGGASAYFALANNYGAYIDTGSGASSGTYALNVNKQGTALLYVRGDGNVGIGTSTPNNKIQVANLINFDDTYFNTALGSGALLSATGSYNVGVGNSALHVNSTGTNNTAVGFDSLLYNINGTYNTAIGFNSLFGNVSGSSNLAAGVESLHTNNSGTLNTALGTAAMYYNNNGTANVAVGNNTLTNNTSGSYNTVIGSYAGSSISSGTNNIIIGSYVDLPNSTNASNYIVIGSGTQHLNIQSVLTNNGSGTNVVVDSNGNILRSSSSIRYKDNIQDLQDNFGAVLNLKPKSFTYKSTGQADIGLIAEDVDAAGLKDLVIYDNQGRPDALKYDRISVYLMEIMKQDHSMLLAHDQAIKDQSQKLTADEQKIADLQSQLTALQGTVSDGLTYIKNQPGVLQLTADKTEVQGSLTVDKDALFNNVEVAGSFVAKDTTIAGAFTIKDNIPDDYNFTGQEDDTTPGTVTDMVGIANGAIETTVHIPVQGPVGSKDYQVIVNWNTDESQPVWATVVDEQTFKVKVANPVGQDSVVSYLIIKRN